MFLSMGSLREIIEVTEFHLVSIFIEADIVPGGLLGTERLASHDLAALLHNDFVHGVLLIMSVLYA
jgi:hypothetical protein